MSSPTPDAGVRRARAEDVAGIGAVHARAWASSYPTLLPGAAAPGADQLAAAWSQAVADPPSPSHRVLVATAGDRVVGFAALAPCGDVDVLVAGTDAELLVLLVDPDEERSGHGSRLLNASVDIARENRFERIRAWVPEPDAARQRFLQGAGFALDGATRVLDASGDGTTTVRELRMGAVIADDA